MNTDKKSFSIFFIILIILCLVFTYMFTYTQSIAIDKSDNTAVYQSTLFDSEKLQTIHIVVDSDEWEGMIENAISEEYIQADVLINNDKVSNIGIRCKGNSSLTQVYNSESDRYSFKIEFDHYNSGQSYYGLDKLCLNNAHSDASYLREFMAYALFEFMDVPSPLYSMSEVYVNDEYIGCYLVLEDVEDAFLNREYGSLMTTLYKPDAENMSRGGESNNQGADFDYIDEFTSSYSLLFDSVVTNESKQSETVLIEAMKAIELNENIEQYFDVEEILRYIACNAFLNNMDSMFGNMLHNFYIAEQDGIISLVPWDYNLAFGGFMQQDASNVINLSIDEPVSGIELADRPLLEALLTNEVYKEYYYEQCQKIVDEYLDANLFDITLTNAQSLISKSVETDPTAFYTFEEFNAAIEQLLIYKNLRSESISKQLSGDDTLVDASSFNLTETGSMMGGKGNGRDNQNKIPPTDMDMTTPPADMEERTPPNMPENEDFVAKDFNSSRKMEDTAQDVNSSIDSLSLIEASVASVSILVFLPMLGFYLRKRRRI